MKNKVDEVVFRKSKVMGILNVTEDSFSDGSKHDSTECAVRHALEMVEKGADIIDIGAESTRPGAKPIEPKTEIAKLVPVIKELRKVSNITISVDTYKSETARRALEAGADIINDIYALRYDGAMIDVLKDYPHAKIVLMHMKGTPADMQINPQYKNVLVEVIDFLKERIDYCVDNAVTEDRIIVDPGIGFGKTFEHNVAILRNIDKFSVFNVPVLLGASRKSFINSIYQSEPQERLIGSLATTVAAGLKNVDIVRVHDVKEHKEMIESMAWVL